MHGRFFQSPAPSRGLGELPDTPLAEGGTLRLSPPVNRPPRGNQSAPTQTPGEFRPLAENQSSWQFITFSVGAEPIKIQDFLYRKFLLIQNKSGAGTLFVGFGYAPNAGNGLVLPSGVGYEPYTYPVNEIYVASDGPIVDGLLIYGV